MSPRTKDLLWLTALVALPRVLVFPFVDNWFGDSIIRSELGERWAIVLAKFIVKINHLKR